uniref:Uncharacterized protein n=1 Tax=Anguilla anguilla TaxID=7936 RepID=A0A0E9XF77_ANGAN
MDVFFLNLIFPPHCNNFTFGVFCTRIQFHEFIMRSNNFIVFLYFLS